MTFFFLINFSHEQHMIRMGKMLNKNFKNLTVREIWLIIKFIVIIEGKKGRIGCQYRY